MTITKRTKIITTIGPSSQTKETISSLFDAGMTTIRLNFSHGTYEEHLERIHNTRLVAKEKGVPISIMLDTKGPEVRVGLFKHNVQKVIANQTITFFTDNDSYKNVKAKVNQFTTSYDISRDLKVDNLILIDDGKLQLRVIDVKPNLIKAIALNSHRVKSNKRVNLPGVVFSMPFLSSQDIEDIEFGCDNDVDFIAASFVNTPSDIKQIRKILARKNASYIQIFSKIESQYAVDNFDKILEETDGIMIARGDLGLEIPYYEVPVVQKMMIRKCRQVGKPVIVATQMLDSMEKNPHPTRAEVTDVYFATELGADATMLSGESAAGIYPIKAVEVMSTINQRAEKEFYNKLFYKAQLQSISKISHGSRAKIAKSVANKTINGDYKFAIVLSRTGQLLKEVAKFRPNTNILGVTNDQRQVTLFGITSSVFMYPDIEYFNKIKSDIKEAFVVAKLYGAQKNDKILVVENQSITSLVFK